MVELWVALRAVWKDIRKAAELDSSSAGKEELQTVGELVPTMVASRVSQLVDRWVKLMAERKVVMMDLRLVAFSVGQTAALSRWICGRLST
jgi:hypothetical protein